MISVVMANFNGAGVVSAAVQSVLDQDYDDYELVVIEDRSKDNSLAILSDLEEKSGGHLRVVPLGGHRGQGTAFNTALKNCSGELVCLIESDDLWFPDKLRNLAALVGESKKSAIYQHNLLRMEGTTLTAERYRPAVFTGDLFRHVKEMCDFPIFVPMSGLAFPRWVLDKVLPIPAKLTTAVDAYLTRSAFCHGPITSTNECWGAYRLHDKERVYAIGSAEMDTFVTDQLLPALNAYYVRNGFDLRLLVIPPGEVYEETKSTHGILEAGRPEDGAWNRIGDNFIIAKRVTPDPDRQRSKEELGF